MAGSAAAAHERKPRYRGLVWALDQSSLDGRRFMKHGKPHEMLTTKTPSSEQQGSRDWAKLIVKLRWIGLEDEARLLERALSALPAEERGTVAAGPFSTD